MKLTWIWIIPLAAFAAHAGDEAHSMCPLAFSKAGLFHEHQALSDHLEKLDSDLGPIKTKAKIKNVQGAFLNFRSYGRAFYSDFVHAIDAEPQVKNLKTFAGNIMGDAHPENFGIRRFGKVDARFGAVDLDDIAQAPLYYDPLRFMTSARLAYADADLKAISKAYREGLNGVDDVKLGKAARALIKSSDDTSLKPDKSFFRDGQLLRKDGAGELTKSAKDSAEQMLRAALGAEVKVVDGYTRTTQTGGSSGVARSVVLVEMPKSSALRNTFDGDYVVYELKPMRKSIAAFAGNPDHYKDLSAKQMNSIARNVTDGSAAPVTEFVNWNDQSYIMRARLRSDEPVKIEDVKQAHMQELLEDEARALGAFHLRSNAGMPLKEYSDVYKQVEADLIKTADGAAEQFKAMDKTLHP